MTENELMVRLDELPEKIATAGHELVELRSSIADLRTLTTNTELDCKQGIANDKDLKNDTQRKAALVTMLGENDGYLESMDAMSNMTDDIGKAECDIEKLRSELSIKKLFLRNVIANKELKLKSKSRRKKMGLDIDAYGKCKYDRAFDEDYYTKNDLVYVYENPDFTHALTEDEGLYSYEESFDFHAGAYDAYNEWREKLSYEMLGASPQEVWENADQYKGKPFYELIDFSDCDGTIGTKTSEKLYNDFKDNITKASEIDDRDFIMQYQQWMHAFDIAKDDGFVVLS